MADRPDCVHLGIARLKGLGNAMNAGVCVRGLPQTKTRYRLTMKLKDRDSQRVRVEVDVVEILAETPESETLLTLST